VLSAAAVTYVLRYRSLIHFHRYQHCPISENRIRCKLEVETVPQTGSTNNLTTETDIDAISVAIPMFWGKFFTGVYANLKWHYLHPEVPIWRTDTGSSYNFATENDIKVLTADAATFRARPIHFYRCPQYPTSENSIRYKPEVETVPKTGCLHLTLFSEVGHRRFERSRNWNAQNIAVALEIASISVSVSELLVLPVCTWWCSPKSEMSMPVKVDGALCPKTLPQPLRSRWYRFPSPNYNYFRYPSAILKFSVENRRVRLAYKSAKNLPPKTYV